MTEHCLWKNDDDGMFSRCGTIQWSICDERADGRNCCANIALRIHELLQTIRLRLRYGTRRATKRTKINRTDGHLVVNHLRVGNFCWLKRDWVAGYRCSSERGTPLNTSTDEAWRTSRQPTRFVHFAVLASCSEQHCDNIHALEP